MVANTCYTNNLFQNACKGRPLGMHGLTMIISHKHKLIFLKPRKVAGTSFEIALSKFLGKTDVITPITPSDETVRRELGFYGKQNYLYPFSQLTLKQKAKAVLKMRLPEKYFNHMSAKACRGRLGAETWQNFRKLSIVRCPWDAAISRFYWANGKDADLAGFTVYFLENPQFLSANRAQYLIDGECCVDIALRFEHFQEDIGSLEKELPSLHGLWEVFSGLGAKSGFRPSSIPDIAEVYRQHPSVDALIRQLNEFEISQYEYSMDL